jgi:protein disulfide-isomerase
MSRLSDSSTDPSDPTGSGGKRKSKRFSQVFWLAFLVLSLAYAWYCFYVPSNEVNWAEDFSTAQQLASSSEKPILLFFTAEWCVPCRIMKREVFADPEVVKVINARLIPLAIYADDPGAAQLFEHYNIGGTPITIVTDAAGEVIDYAVGGIDKSEFLELIGI